MELVHLFSRNSLQAHKFSAAIAEDVSHVSPRKVKAPLNHVVQHILSMSSSWFSKLVLKLVARDFHFLF